MTSASNIVTSGVAKWQCFSNESEATCKNSADLEEEEKTPKTLLLSASLNGGGSGN